MRIGIDVMGGDFAPDAVINGAILATEVISKEDCQLVLIGNESIIKEKLVENHFEPARFEIVHAPDIIRMGEQPTRAFTQKPKSSINTGFSLLKKQNIDAFASAGNTGAMLVGALYSINAIPGIIRPATTSILPKEEGGVGVLIDVGTNPDSKPDVLYQFGLLGSIYAQNLYNIKNPRVALLNIGEEEEKGNLLTQSAYRLMKDSKDFNFIGNIESRNLFKDKADVIVCDGFTGNIVLKEAEAIYRLMLKRGITDEYFDRFNYEDYGGTPILGVNGSVIVGHGISNKFAIKNMILLTKEIHKARIDVKIKTLINKYTQGNNI